MKGLKFILLTVLLNSVQTLSAQWQPIPSYPAGPTDGAASFVINGLIYLGGGNGLHSFYEFNPETEVWTEKAAIPGNIDRRWLMGFSIGGKGYMGGGDKTDDSDIANDFYEYDPATDKWTQIADFGGGDIYGGYACSLNGKGYVFLGGNKTAALADVWMYDPENDAWSQKRSYPGGESTFPTGFVIGNHIYVGTGSAEGNTSNTSFYRYTPETDIWEKRADFPMGRQACVGFSIGSKGYIGGGENNYAYTFESFWSYNHWEDEWTLEKEMDFPIHEGNKYASVAWSVVCVHNNNVYLGTGADFIGFSLNFSDRFHKISIEPTNTNEVTPKTNLTIFPNPATNTIKIQSSNLERFINFSIVNSSGKTVLVSSEVSNSIDIAHLPDGFYHILLTDGNTSVSKKLVISKQ